MKTILAALCAGVLAAGTFAVSRAELPPPNAEEKAGAAAKAEKEQAEKAKAAKEVSEAQDRAVANYRKNKGLSSAGTSEQPAPQQDSSSTRTPAQSQGADHSKPSRPDSELTRQEAQTEMPKPGQVNDHSTPARDPQNSSGRQ